MNAQPWLFDTYRISRREREVCRQLLTGATTDDMAYALCISQRTFKLHITSINSKFGTRDRTQIVLVLLGAIDPPNPPIPVAEQEAA